MYHPDSGHACSFSGRSKVTKGRNQAVEQLLLLVRWLSKQELMQGGTWDLSRGKRNVEWMND